jgi:hypothetical protein
MFSRISSRVSSRVLYANIKNFSTYYSQKNLNVNQEKTKVKVISRLEKYIVIGQVACASLTLTIICNKVSDLIL